jgi:hypothetical protein
MTDVQVTFAIAVWGAVTGTIAIVLQALQFRADLRITAHLSNTVDIQRPTPRLVFVIEATNHGRRVVSIRRAGIELPPPDGPLPPGVIAQTSYVRIFDSDEIGSAVTLGEGGIHAFCADPFPVETARKFQESATAFVEDSLGRRYTSTFYSIKRENLPKP